MQEAPTNPTFVVEDPTAPLPPPKESNGAAGPLPLQQTREFEEEEQVVEDAAVVAAVEAAVNDAQPPMEAATTAAAAAVAAPPPPLEAATTAAVEAAAAPPPIDAAAAAPAPMAAVAAPHPMEDATAPHPMEAATTAAAAAAAAAASLDVPVAPPPTKRARRSKSETHAFNDMLYELLKFRTRHDHCRVPIKTSGALGKWVANIRAQYLSFQRRDQPPKSLRDGLTPDRIEVLNSIGFVWDLARYDLEARWNTRFQELIQYKQQHGHCNAPQSTDLGRWVKMQREQYRETAMRQSGQPLPKRVKPRPTLSQERIARLESIGFAWTVAPPAVGWERRFEELLEYRRIHGDCNVPQAYAANRSLGRWVMKQRCQYTLKQKGEHSQLTDERVERLNAVGFSWGGQNFRKKKQNLDDVHRAWI